MKIRFWIISAEEAFCCLAMKEMFPPTTCDDGLDGIRAVRETCNFLFLLHFQSVMLNISVNAPGSEEMPSVVRISATSRPQLSTQKLFTLQSIHQSLHSCTNIKIWSKQVKQQNRWNCHSVSISFIRVLKLLCCYFLPSYTLVLLSELLNWFGDWVTIQPLGKQPLVCLCFCCWVQDLVTQLLSDCFLKKAKKWSIFFIYFRITKIPRKWIAPRNKIFTL